MRFPEIDYETHPAYAPYRSDTRYDDALIDQHVQAVDRISAEFCALDAPSERDAEDACGQVLSNLQAILVHVHMQNASVLAEEWLHACVLWTMADFRYEFVRRVFSGREYRSKALDASQQAQLEAMQMRGMYIADLPADIYGRIRSAALQYLPELKARSLRDPYTRSVTNVVFNSPLWKAVKHGVSTAKVLDVLSEFKRNEMILLGAGLEYSSPQQRWYRSLYADVGLEDGPFQYMHVDEGYCIPKAMIYITPVSEENGPTRVIPGSNRWGSSECRVRMYRALDRVASERYDKLAAKGSYRILTRFPELRRIFMQLPKAFRGSSHFGDDILPNTQLAKELAPLERPYLSSGRQTLVFDGPHLLHRGSLITDGERLALQLVYRNRNEQRIKSRIAKETFLREQVALGRKYARRFVMEYL